MKNFTEVSPSYQSSHHRIFHNPHSKKKSHKRKPQLELHWKNSSHKIQTIMSQQIIIYFSYPAVFFYSRSANIS